MSDALHPIDVPCPECHVPDDRKCRISAAEEREGIKSFHPARLEAVGMSPTGSYLRAARRASESPIPFASDRVVFIWNTGTHTSANHLRFANTVQDKIRLLSGRRRKVYCVWPGDQRSDLFYIDEPDKVLAWLQERPATHKGDDIAWG